jgi:alkanesulfonate monooxygenase SsuD/methylene tetrahydromethanopterin reductase-like flavin-dependent oxidoreductase (luciferase family)
MRFGVVFPIQDVQETLDVLLGQLRAEVRAADEAGFDAFFLPEFHQTRAGGVISPLLTGAALAEGTRRIRDLLDVIDAAWSGEPFDVTGTHGRWRGHVTPAPFGGKRPEVVMGAHGPRGLELAGQRADLWLSDPQRHVDLVARLAGRVRSAAEAAGRQVRIGMFRDGWIGDSREACEKLWLPHALAVHRLYLNVGVYLEEFAGASVTAAA